MEQNFVEIPLKFNLIKLYFSFYRVRLVFNKFDEPYSGKKKKLIHLFIKVLGRFSFLHLHYEIRFYFN